MAGPEQQKKRMANIELLRLLAMMMVVSLHYLAKGDLLESLTGTLSAKGYLAWFLESFSIVAVDVYVLISGYFLVETGFRSRRVISLVLQVMFYTCLIPLLMAVMGGLPSEARTIHSILLYVFPTNMLHYWFVSAYVLMFLFTPVLNAAVRAMKKKQLQAVIVVLLLMESVSKTVIPVQLELDNRGYDAYWFMVVYLIAAYIRIYGIPLLEKKRRAALCYVLACTGIFGLTMLFRAVCLATGQLEYFVGAAYGYNHLLVIAAAVALFYMFKNSLIPKKDSRLGALICKIAPYSFGVYLFHEQVNLRYLWPAWLGAGQCTSAFSLLGHWLSAVLIVMAAGLAVDYIRGLLFGKIGKLLSGGRLDRALRKADDRINGLSEMETV